MIICHLSDTHSQFPEIPSEAEIIVHSGDLFPNCSSDDPVRQREYQRLWLNQNADNIKEWIKDKPFLFCSGNHDYLDWEFETFLKSYGIKAKCLNDKLIEFKGKTWYGFPYINITGGDWNYELPPEQMEKYVQIIKRQIIEFGKPLDILVAHSPPFKILDYFGLNNFGVEAFSHWLQEEFETFPNLMLCGHIHSAHGRKVFTDTVYKDKKIIINSATVVNLVEV